MDQCAASRYWSEGNVVVVELIIDLDTSSFVCFYSLFDAKFGMYSREIYQHTKTS